MQETIRTTHRDTTLVTSMNMTFFDTVCFNEAKCKLQREWVNNKRGGDQCDELNSISIQILNFCCNFNQSKWIKSGTTVFEVRVKECLFWYPYFSFLFPLSLLYDPHLKD